MCKFVILEEYEYEEFHPVMINVDKIVGICPIEKTNANCVLTMIYTDGFNWQVKGTFDEVTNKIKHVCKTDNIKF